MIFNGGYVGPTAILTALAIILGALGLIGWGIWELLT